MIYHTNCYNTSSEFVYLQLRAKIVNKQLKPGERLPEVKISKEMGVSRTPVREALRKLTSEGLVRIIPNSGARVTAPSLSEIEGAYNVREHLEALSVQLACHNGIDRRTAERFEEVIRDEEFAFRARNIEASLEANNNFHKLIADASKNIVLIEYVENIILRTNVYILFFDPLTEEKNYSSEEHRRILNAILSKDETSADKLMKDHLRHSHSVLEKPYERRNILAKMNGLDKQNEAFSSQGGISYDRTGKIPSFDLTRNYNRVKEEIRVALDRVLETQHFILGPEVECFEKEIASYLEVENAVGCASGTDALLLSLMALDLKEGDEVITTPFTFFATASCITRNGAKPVFADVDPDSYNLSMESVMEKITPRTKVVLPVHLFGQTCKLELITDELSQKGIAIVEDCAQAIGAHRIIDKKICRAGSIGDIGCLSFFPTKNLGCYGDGGMVSIPHNKEISDRIRNLRVHGSGKTYFHDEIGINSRLDAVQAAILRVRIRHLEEWNEERRIVAERYMLLFKEKGLLDVITLPVEEDGNRHVYHQYVVKAERRDELQEYLERRGISTRVYYPLPLHMQHCFSYLGYKEGDFPVSEKLAGSVLALPIFPELLPEEQERVVEEIAGFYGRQN